MKSEGLPLLCREARAALPLRRQLVLYLDPFSLFIDASRGNGALRRRALAHNRAMRGMLVAYLRRWLFIAAALFLAIVPTEAAAAEVSLFIVPAAALAVGCCVALTMACCITAAWLLLGARNES